MLSDDELRAGRSAALEAILASDARFKLVVAGPGTGKTHTFQSIVNQTEGRCLVITFLQVLVKDLETKFGDSADVYSFHSFARKLLHQGGIAGLTPSVHYYHSLPLLLVEDIRIIDGGIVSPLQLGALFRNLADSEALLQLTLRRGEYLAAVSHDDAVYRVLRAMESNSSLIPAYAQVVVDEFQDFCPMEVAFIKALSAVNPTLIVGDDDQALYAFRDATPAAIRSLAADDSCYRREYLRTTVGMAARIFGDGFSLGN